MNQFDNKFVATPSRVMAKYVFVSMFDTMDIPPMYRNNFKNKF